LTASQKLRRRMVAVLSISWSDNGSQKAANRQDP
jgi:hypothetical protein